MGATINTNFSLASNVPNFDRDTIVTEYNDVPRVHVKIDSSKIDEYKDIETSAEWQTALRSLETDIYDDGHIVYFPKIYTSEENRNKNIGTYYRWNANINADKVYSEDEELLISVDESIPLTKGVLGRWELYNSVYVADDEVKKWNRIAELFYDMNYKPVFSANPSSIYEGVKKNVVLSSSLSINNVNQSFDIVSLKKGNDIIENSEANNIISYSKTVNEVEGGTKFYINIKKDTYTKQLEKTITKVIPTFCKIINYNFEGDYENTFSYNGFNLVGGDIHKPVSLPYNIEYKDVTFIAGQVFCLAIPSAENYGNRLQYCNDNNGFYAPLLEVKQNNETYKRTFDLGENYSNIEREYKFYIMGEPQAAGTHSIYVSLK